MLRGSFRLLSRAVLPLALLFILAACGGSAKPQPVSTSLIHGNGFTFTAPAAWAVTKTSTAAAVRKGSTAVSVTFFRLLKPYDPARFDSVAKELDGVAAKLAAQAGGKLSESSTVTVDGLETRSYRYEAKGTHVRVGFVLKGRREYQLLCLAASDDPGGACALLFSSFTAA